MIINKHSFDFDKINLRWQMEPYPHAIIDNFLPNELFKKISSLDVNTLSDKQKSFNNDIEGGKNVYGVKEFDENLMLPVKLMGEFGGKKLFS